MAINYRDEDFVEEVRDATDGRGADVILDNMGAKYLGRNVDALAVNGRLVIIGMQGGIKAELNIGTLLASAARSSRPRCAAGRATEKAAICAGVVEHVCPLRGRRRRSSRSSTAMMPLDDGARRARADGLRRTHTGKILLHVVMGRPFGAMSEQHPTRPSSPSRSSTS